MMIFMASLRDLEVRHLVAFDAVAKEGAVRHGRPRSSATPSRRSANRSPSLERLVDGKLFDRPGGPKPVELTPLGEQMLVSARELLARVDAVGEELDRFRTARSAASRSAPTRVSRPRCCRWWWVACAPSTPRSRSVCRERSSTTSSTQALARGALDLSFVVGDWPGQFESQPLFADPFVLVARPGTSSTGAVRLSELVGVPMVGQHANSCQLMNEMGLRAAGLEPNYVFRTNDNGTVSAMVKAGLGVAVMPLLCVEPNDPGLALHALRPALPDRRISIAWRKGRTLSPVAVASSSSRTRSRRCSSTGRSRPRPPRPEPSATRGGGDRGPTRR